MIRTIRFDSTRMRYAPRKVKKIKKALRSNLFTKLPYQLLIFPKVTPPVPRVLATFTEI